MQRARLLHTPEQVEILSIDVEAGIAKIRRQGFEQQVPITQLVWEEDKVNLEELSSFSLSGTERVILELLPRLSEGRAELQVRLSKREYQALCALYIQNQEKGWDSLLATFLTGEKGFSLQVSLERYPPPWRLILQYVEVPAQSVRVVPSPSTAQFFVKLSAFLRDEIQRLAEDSPSPQSLPSSSSLLSLPNRIEAGSHIDLHVEVLAPELRSSSPEIIFEHQIHSMKRYLFACEAAGQREAIVIHGVGKKRLQAALMKFCQEQGWRVEPLLLPPYLGGASRVFLE
ncbi:MAG: hypothetical protein NZ611_03270 [Bacteroidia bacterium]|nr:hypothetical protein [Bacteroidia bacterium]